MVLIGAVTDCGFCPGGVSPSIPEWMPILVAGIGLASVTLLIVAAAVLRFNGREIPGWLLPVTAFAYGLGASLMVILWSLPSDWIGLLLLVGGVFGPAILAALARRFELGGWILVGAGLPALLWRGYFVVQDILNDGLLYEESLALWFGLTAVTVLLGLVGIGLGNRTPAALPRPAPNEPDPERAVALARAILNEMRLGPLDLPNVVAIGVGAFVAGAVSLGLRLFDVPDFWRGIAFAVTFTLIATELVYHAWPRRLALARAAHAFVGSWEVKRFRSTCGPAVPTSAEAARAWLAANPESDANRWVRPELLAWAGELDEAYAVIGRMPETTEAELFDRHAMKAHLDLVSGAGADADALAADAERVGLPGSDERLRALAVVAMQQARERLVTGSGDWLAPMVKVQELIGPRSLGILRSDTWWLRFRSLATFSLILLALGSLLSVLSA